jgi:predicted nucleotidyltransferase
MPKDVRDNVIECLKKWSQKTHGDLFLDFWVFGSIISGEGEQFIPERSDIDLAILLADSLEDELNRTQSCKALRDLKFKLEQELLKILSRTFATEPIVSIVLLTKIELVWDIHKSKVLRFFRDAFHPGSCLNLLGNTDFPSINGITGREDERLSAVIQALEVTQKYRNEYLAISPNGSLKVQEHTSKEVFPKELARSSAQVCWANKVADQQSKFDIPSGTSYLTDLLKRKTEKNHNQVLKALEKKIQKRTYPSQYRDLPGLDDFDLLLLHELLFDQACILIRSNAFLEAQHPDCNSASEEALGTNQSLLHFKQSRQSLQNQLVLGLPPPKLIIGETETLDLIKSFANPQYFSPDFAHKSSEFLVELNNQFHELIGGKSRVGEEVNFLYHAFSIASRKLQLELQAVGEIDGQIKAGLSNKQLVDQARNHLSNMELVMSGSWRFIEQRAPDYKLNECKYYYSRLIKTIRDLQDSIAQKGDLGKYPFDVEMQISDLRLYTERCSAWLDKLASDSRNVIKVRIMNVEH